MSNKQTSDEDQEAIKNVQLRLDQAKRGEIKLTGIRWYEPKRMTLHDQNFTFTISGDNK